MDKPRAILFDLGESLLTKNQDDDGVLKACIKAVM